MPSPDISANISFSFLFSHHVSRSLDIFFNILFEEAIINILDYCCTQIIIHISPYRTTKWHQDFHSVSCLWPHSLLLPQRGCHLSSPRWEHCHCHCRPPVRGGIHKRHLWISPTMTLTTAPKQRRPFAFLPRTWSSWRKWNRVPWPCPCWFSMPCFLVKSWRFRGKKVF